MRERVVGRGRRVEVVVLDGDLPDDALAVLLGAELDGRVADLWSVHLGLRSLGYDVATHVHVPSRGDGRGGRLPVVLRRGDEVVALERSDRAKAREKLERFEAATARVIVRAA